MKFLYSHRTRSADGQYVHIRALSEALKARGHGLTMCGPDDGPENNEGGFRTLDAGASNTGSRSLAPRPIYEAAEFAYSALGYRKLNRLAKKIAPDIIYERYNLFYHAGVRLARARGLALILEVNAPLAEEREKHDGLSLKKFAAWSQASLWRAADAVLPVTGVLGAYVEAAGVAPEKITIIQNGVDETFLGDCDPRAIKSRYGLAGRLVLGFTGFVRDWHGVDRVLNFMAHSERDDLHLLLVGDGPAREGLQRQAAALGLSERFTVAGVVQREAMPVHAAVFDIALQPAVVDYASPLKLFEYMAAGRAILAPARANIKEILSDGEDAILFDPDHEAGFERALSQLVEDAALRARLGAAARASLLRQKLTWAHNAARVERIAENLIEARR